MVDPQADEANSSIKKICKFFGEDPKTALKLLDSGESRGAIFEKKKGHTPGIVNASFDVYEGEVFVIMGLTSSRKSMLVIDRYMISRFTVRHPGSLLPQSSRYHAFCSILECHV